MKIKINLLNVILLGLLIALSPSAYPGGAKNHNATYSEPHPCPGSEIDGINAGLECRSLKGWSQGNHELDCTIIIPGIADSDNKVPLIAWANGWDQGNVVGQCTTNGYLKGLKEWAKSGSHGYIIAATNAWSVQESDVLACAQWVVDNASDEEIPFDGENIGLVGHSQGGGAVIKAGNGTNKGAPITAVLAMNPYGPAWVNSENQDGPVMILGGSMDTTTPPGSYQAAWDAIKDKGDNAMGPGGINAELKVGTHNSEAWNGSEDYTSTLSCEDAADENFGVYQSIGQTWWDIQLKNADDEVTLKMALDNAGIWQQPTGYSNFPDDP